MTDSTGPSARHLIAIALVSATLLMTELALTRIFSVIMYYHFAFLAISIALFGLSASGVFAYVARTWLGRYATGPLLAVQSLVYAVATLVALFFLVRMRVGLSYSPENLRLMLTIYALAALPFFTGGLVITLAVSRMTSRINTVYAADLMGAAGGCLVLIPLLDRLGAPGVVLAGAFLSILAALLFTPATNRLTTGMAGLAILAVPLVGQFSGLAGFDVVDTKGHKGDRVLFSKWNSFSRVGVYDRAFGDWSLSRTYRGPRPDSRFMDIDSAASTPILAVAPDLSNARYLRYELTALAYHLVERGPGAGGLGLGASPSPGFTALVIGPGGGRDLVSALVFGASRVDGVEINPIIANDVMRDRFREFSGGIYTDPRVRITVDDGRSFVRRSPDKYDVIQASLVDTWAATAAGAYTLTENSLYTVEAFDDYLDHLHENGILTITRWVFDGLRLVSLAQEACEARGCSAADQLAVVRQNDVATFLLKRTPFTSDEIDHLRSIADQLQFDILYLPGAGSEGPKHDDLLNGTRLGDYDRLIRAADRHAFYASYPQDITPTTDDRPFFFHTTTVENQFETAFGRSMLFGNGLSALLTLMAISATLVVLFIIGPLIVYSVGPAKAGHGERSAEGELPRRWFAWLAFFGALGAGFMLIEVAALQRFVLLLGHPVYSLTVTLFSLLLGTGLGAAWSRRFGDDHLRRTGALGLAVIAALACAVIVIVTPLVAWAIPFARPTRMALAAATLIPFGIALGLPMPTGLRMLGTTAPQMIPWAWGINGALSVVGATLAIFIAMNWGFDRTLLTAAVTYVFGLGAFLVATAGWRAG